jgi:hypothetical protein
MIVLKIFFDTLRSREWYRNVLPDVPLTVFRMDDTFFQKSVQLRSRVRKLPPYFQSAHANRISSH